MTFTENHTEEQKQKVELAQKILGYEFKNPEILLAAITHPSATEGKPVKFSYERLEFLGDSILGAVVASEAFPMPSHARARTAEPLKVVIPFAPTQRSRPIG